MLNIRPLFRCFLTTLLIGSASAQADTSAAPGNHVDALSELRLDYAKRFFEPEPHMNLAKYHHDEGNRLLAFYVLESARRSRFEQPVFDAAFRATFVDDVPFDNSEEAERKRRERARVTPDDAENQRRLADIFISRSDWDQAEPYLQQAIETDPEDFGSHAALAEIARRRGDEDRAEAVLAGYYRRYPNSVPAIQERLAEIAEKGNENAAVEAYAEAIAVHPESGELLFDLGVMKQQLGDIEAASTAFVEAARLEPDNAHIQGWTGRFLLKVLKDREAALAHYLNAYFLDPHFYDSEFAESRIRGLAWELAAAEFEVGSIDPVEVIEHLSSENPRIAGFALEWVRENWDERFVDPTISLLRHDDTYVRWTAMEILAEPGLEQLLPRLEGFLVSPDLRERGLAAHLAVRAGGEEYLAAVETMLQAEVQLLRFDAISALVMEGGDQGREILLRHQESETHPYLVALLEQILMEVGAEQ